MAQRQCGRVRSSPKPAANRSAYLQKHVSGLNTAISSHSAPLHDGADVDASVTPLITLAHDGDTQEVVLLCGGSSHEGTKAQKPWRSSPPLLSWGPSIPMLSVTVMMLRDIVESVTLLKDEVCDRDREERGEGSSSTETSPKPLVKGPAKLRPASPKRALTLSMRGGRCFLRLRWRLRRREALLCSVELLNLIQSRSRTCGGGSGQGATWNGITRRLTGRRGEQGRAGRGRR